MAKYIDLEKAIAEIDKGELLVGNNAEWAKDILLRMPTVDVAEVRRGEWIWAENGEADYEQYWVCSVCGEKSYIETKYCSDCGAKMDGGVTE
jgi:hypothetical protein